MFRLWCFTMKKTKNKQKGRKTKSLSSRNLNWSILFFEKKKTNKTKNISSIVIIFVREK